MRQLYTTNQHAQSSPLLATFPLKYVPLAGQAAMAACGRSGGCSYELAASRTTRVSSDGLVTLTSWPGRIGGSVRSQYDPLPWTMISVPDLISPRFMLEERR